MTAELKSATAKEAAANLLKQPNTPLRGLGIDMAEGRSQNLPARKCALLRAHADFRQPSLLRRRHFLIVPTGHETLNPALPYSAGHIKQAMAKRRSQ
jgi:hypothetical protein